MRATGIVRRIDDLGRVVIPKEIRRTLRIREGDPLEIYTESNGEVIFKKYSPIGELAGFTEEYAEVLYKVSKAPIIITDRDHVVASGGISKKEVIGRRISSVLDEYIDGRKAFFASQGGYGKLYPIEGFDRPASVAYPIISAGDVTGAVVMLYNDLRNQPTEIENKLVQTAAIFLGKQNE